MSTQVDKLYKGKKSSHRPQRHQLTNTKTFPTPNRKKLQEKQLLYHLQLTVTDGLSVFTRHLDNFQPKDLKK